MALSRSTIVDALRILAMVSKCAIFNAANLCFCSFVTFMSCDWLCVLTVEYSDMAALVCLANGWLPQCRMGRQSAEK